MIRLDFSSEISNTSFPKKLTQSGERCIFESVGIFWSIIYVFQYYLSFLKLPTIKNLHNFYLIFNHRR